MLLGCVGYVSFVLVMYSLSGLVLYRFISTDVVRLCRLCFLCVGDVFLVRSGSVQIHQYRDRKSVVEIKSVHG
jgi:hypothetical protein